MTRRWRRNGVLIICAILLMLVAAHASGWHQPIIGVGGLLVFASAFVSDMRLIFGRNR